MTAPRPTRASLHLGRPRLAVTCALVGLTAAWGPAVACSSSTTSPDTTASSGSPGVSGPTVQPAPTQSPPASAPVTPSGAAVRLTRGTNGRPVVALTFDAGSDAGSTERILDTLAAEGITASFGITGIWAEQHPELFRRIVQDGHQVLNHTYDHRSWTGASTGTAALTEAERRHELERAEDVFRQIGGATGAPFFRPPYGDVDAATDPLLGQAGYAYDTMWTVDSLGWRGATPDEIVSTVRAGEEPGGILLFHVGSASRDADALPHVIDDIRARGLTPGSVRDVV